MYRKRFSTLVRSPLAPPGGLGGNTRSPNLALNHRPVRCAVVEVSNSFISTTRPSALPASPRQSQPSCSVNSSSSSPTTSFPAAPLASPSTVPQLSLPASAFLANLPMWSSQDPDTSTPDASTPLSASPSSSAGSGPSSRTSVSNKRISLSGRRLTHFDPLSTFDFTAIDEAMKMSSVDQHRGYSKEASGEVKQDRQTEYTSKNQAAGYQLLREPLWNKGMLSSALPFCLSGVPAARGTVVHLSSRVSLIGSFHGYLLLVRSLA